MATYGTPVYVPTANSIEITVASGTQALLFFSANEDAAGTVPAVTSISDGTQSATFPAGARATRGTGPSNSAEIWVVANPTPGTTTWTVSWNSVPDRNRSIICVPVLSGADDAIYEAVGQSTSASSPISTAITTTTAGCDILGIVTHDATSGNFSASNGQSTLLNEANNGISGGGGAETSRVLVSQYSAGAAGTYNLAWTNNGTVTRLCQVLIAITPDTPPEPNPKIETLVESFDGDELPASLEVVSGSPNVTGGALVLPTPVASVQTVDRYDCTDGDLIVEWAMPVSDGDHTQMGCLVASIGNHGYEVSANLDAGILTISRRTGIGGTALYYDSVAAADYRFVRFREDSGTFSVAISDDGSDWTTLASEDTDTNTSFAPTDVAVTLSSYLSLTADPGSTAYIYGINAAAGDDVEAAAAPVAVSAAVVPATASVGTVDAPARATSVVARVLAATVTIGAITAPAVPVQATVLSTAASASTAAISAPAPAIRTTARVLAADVVIGSIEATAPSVRVGGRAVPATAQQVAGAVDFAATRVAVRAVPGSASIGPLTAGVPALSVGARVLPATVTLGDITAESRPVVASARAVTASAQQVTGAVGSAPVALSARVTAADASVDAVATESAPARVLARVVAADVTIGALTVESAPVAVSVRSIPAVGAQVVGAVASVPVRVSAQVLAADVVIGAVSATAPPVRVTIAATPSALSMGTITAPARPVRVAVTVTTATSPEAVTAAAAPVRVVARVLAADVTIGGLAPFPRERRFTPVSRSHGFEAVAHTHSFRTTVRSHTLEVPSD